MAHPIEGLVHRGRVAGAKQQQGARYGTGALEQFGLDRLREVVFDGTDGVDLTALPHPDERQPPRASGLGLAEHIAAGLDPHVADCLIAAGHGDALHRAPRGHRAGEHLEAHVFDQVAHGGELHAVAGVWSVGAEAIHGFMPGEAREGPGQINPFDGLPDADDQGFVELEDLLLIHEAHLDIQLGEFRLAIGPEVFIAEAAGHLVVALNAAHHQQLLEQLGGLGQGKPFAAAHPRWHQVVAGAFRGGAGEDGGFHLDEALVLQVAAGGLDGLGPQPQVAVHALAAQIQIAVAQPQFFAHLFVVVHRHLEGQVAAHAVEHRDGAGQHLDLAGGQAVVDRFGGTVAHRALHLEHRFVAQVFSDGEGVCAEVGIHRDLHAAAAVAQVDEDHSTVVAAAIHPAAELHRLAAGFNAQITAPVAAHGTPCKSAGIFPCDARWIWAAQSWT